MRYNRKQVAFDVRDALKFGHTDGFRNLNSPAILRTMQSVIMAYIDLVQNARDSADLASKNRSIRYLSALAKL